MFVKVANIFMDYQISAIRQAFSLGRAVLGLQTESDASGKTFRALDGLSLEIRETERVGIIGSNGAGKTTLLQIMAGLSRPTAGSVEVEGRVTCVMTLGVGLREDLSGRENIYIDGEINGKSRQEVDLVLDGIIEFADIGEFIDFPVRTYSSGMKARLAFAMITFIEPEILFIDEALGAGDVHFAQKAALKMRELCDKGKILILVSHSMGAIISLCNRCVWIENGRMMMDGAPKEVTEAYLDYVQKKTERKLLEQFSRRISEQSLDANVAIRHLEFLDSEGNPRHIFNVGEDITLRIGVTSNRKIERADIRLNIERADGILLIDNTASEDGVVCGAIEGEAAFEVGLGELRLGKQKYLVKAELFDGHTEPQELLAIRTTVLIIENPEYPYENPVTYSPVEWRIELQG